MLRSTDYVEKGRKTLLVFRLVYLLFISSEQIVVVENCRFFARAQDVDLSPVSVPVSPSPTFHARVKTTLVANLFQESTLFTEYSICRKVVCQNGL